MSENLPGAELTDDELNKRIHEFADYDVEENDPHGYGKRLPYFGWWWRDIKLSEGYIPIGQCGEFIGIMVRDKWDCLGRRLTETETVTFKEKLYRALNAPSSKDRDAICDELWEWFQCRPFGMAMR